MKPVSKKKTRQIVMIMTIARTLLYARRNGKIKVEQKAHQDLVIFCDKNNLDFNNVLEGATKIIRESIAGGMNGLGV